MDSRCQARLKVQIENFKYVHLSSDLALTLLDFVMRPCTEHSDKVESSTLQLRVLKAGKGLVFSFKYPLELLILLDYIYYIYI